MQWQRIILVIMLGVGLAQTATAGIFFNRAKPSPQRAAELIGILKTDPNESKRASAADELGHYDGKTNPEIVPVLIEALSDTSASVRNQAVQSLGKIRPVSQEAGSALEQTMANDSSTKIRIQARTTLWQYHMAGYRTPKNEGPALKAPPQPTQPPATTTTEPPLAVPFPTPPAPAAPPPAYRLTPAPVEPPPALPQLSRPVPPADQGPTLNAPQ
jgi:hypothetical protein